MTTTTLAAGLGVDPGDVQVLLALLAKDEPALVDVDQVPDDAAAFVRQMLDPHGERTAPAGFYWPDADPEPPQVYGIGGPDPTAPRP